MKGLVNTNLSNCTDLIEKSKDRKQRFMSVKNTYETLTTCSNAHVTLNVEDQVSDYAAVTACGKNRGEVWNKILSLWSKFKNTRFF